MAGARVLLAAAAVLTGCALAATAARGGSPTGAMPAAPAAIGTVARLPVAPPPDPPAQVAAPRRLTSARRTAPTAPPSPSVAREAPLVPTSRPSTEVLMWQAVRKIPVQLGDVKWVLSRRYTNLGTAVYASRTVYISPDVPPALMYDVVAHEWSHEKSVLAYPSVTVAMTAMSVYFGGDVVTGTERAADCMARQLGAIWTYYTPCTDARWRAGAARLLAGLPV